MFSTASRKASGSAPVASTSTSTSGPTSHLKTTDSINHVVELVRYDEADYRAKQPFGKLKRPVPGKENSAAPPKKRSKSKAAVQEVDVQDGPQILKPPARAFILDMPPEVLSHVASYLKTRDHVMMTRTCQQWRKGLRSMPGVWSRLDMSVHRKRKGGGHQLWAWLQTLLGLANGKLESFAFSGEAKRFKLVSQELRETAKFGSKDSLRSLNFGFNDSHNLAPIESLALVEEIGDFMATFAACLRSIDFAVAPPQSLHCLSYPRAGGWPEFPNLRRIVLRPGANWKPFLDSVVAPLETIDIVTLYSSQFSRLLERHRSTLRDITVGVMPSENERPHGKLELPDMELPNLQQMSLMAPSVTIRPSGCLSAPALQSVCVSELSKIKLFTLGSLSGVRSLVIHSEHHLLASQLSDVPGLQTLRIVGPGLTSACLEPLCNTLVAPKLDQLELKIFGNSDIEGLGEALVNLVDTRRHGAAGFTMEQILVLRQRRVRRAGKTAAPPRWQQGAGAMGGARKSAVAAPSSVVGETTTNSEVGTDEASSLPASDIPLCVALTSIVIDGQHNLSAEVIAYLNRHLSEPIQCR